MANSRWGKKTAKAQGASQINGDEVARVAYELYEQRGRAHGQDLGDWLQAEAIVRRRRHARSSL